MRLDRDPDGPRVAVQGQQDRFPDAFVGAAEVLHDVVVEKDLDCLAVPEQQASLAVVAKFGSCRMILIRVPCARIKPDPRSPGCLPQEVDVLADSIRQNGLLRPILVRKTADGYVIVHGERRWRAVRALGQATIVAWLVLDFLHRSAGAL